MIPLPREHGAWGLLLQPFAAGAILANHWTWHMFAALGLVLCGFLLREPLTILARQRFVWRTLNPQTAAAARWCAAESAAALLCLALLVPTAPLAPMRTQSKAPISTFKA